MNLTMMLVFAVMAYGALSSPNIVDDFRLGVQLCKGVCDERDDAPIKYTKYLSEIDKDGGWTKKGGCSGWSGHSGKLNSFRVGIFTKNGQKPDSVRIEGKDFRFAIEVDHGSGPHANGGSARRYTKWASRPEGGDWSEWAGSFGFDLKWIRVRLQVRDRANLVITNVKIGAWASTFSVPDQSNGPQRITGWLQGSGDSTLWTWRARHVSTKYVHYAKIYMEVKKDTSSPAMSVEKEAMHSDLEVVGEPSDERNPMVFAALIGAAALAIVAVLAVVLGRWMKRKQPAKEPVAEMSEVADTPNVVHVAEETAEAVTTGTAPETETETVAAAPEAAVEVVVKEEAVEMEAVSGGDVL